MEEKGHELSLYRRWRPLRFADVVGQDLAVRTLRRAVAQQRLAHALLFSGQRGVGKTSVARILARAVNCTAPQEGEPCNACDSCNRILGGASLDVVEIDGASNRGIDQMRQLREQVGYVPAGAQRKVYIIDEVHMLTGEAFNALLKTLEEPPPRVLFILATTEPHKVPLTVLSRCQAYEFAPLGIEQMEEKLLAIARDEGLELEPAAAKLIARRSGGALRDAEGLLEQLAHSPPVTQQTVQEVLGLPTDEVVDSFVSALAHGDAGQPLSTVEELASRGRDLGMFLEEAATRARDRIIAGESELISVARALVRWRAELPRAVSRRLHVELGILELCGRPTENRRQDPRPEDSPKTRTTKDSDRDAPDQPQCKAEPSAPTCAAKAPSRPNEVDPEWQEFVRKCYPQSKSLAVFLLPANHQLTDGVLRIILPAEYRFNYDVLQEPEVRRALEEAAQEHFGALLAVHVEWEGVDNTGPSLEDKANIAAEILEGEIVKEQSS